MCGQPAIGLRLRWIRLVRSLRALAFVLAGASEWLGIQHVLLVRRQPLDGSDRRGLRVALRELKCASLGSQRMLFVGCEPLRRSDSRGFRLFIRATLVISVGSARLGRRAARHFAGRRVVQNGSQT
jgi:hypothetical protein